MFGFPVADFSRMFVNYSYETVRMTDLNEALIDPVVHLLRRAAARSSRRWATCRS